MYGRTMEQFNGRGAERLVETRRAPALAALRRFPVVTPVAPPGWAAKDASTPAKAKGYSYERKVGTILHKKCSELRWKLWDHQWFVYRAGEHMQYFQPDFVIERPNELGIIAEVKLTYVDTSVQLNRYVAYLKLFGVVCFPITIVKNLTPAVAKDFVVDDLSKAQTNSVLHLWV